MKVRKLTPKLLKRIIAEEKAKLKLTKRKPSSKKSLVEKKAEQLTKLALLEVREKLRLKKIQRARRLVKKSLR